MVSDELRTKVITVCRLAIHKCQTNGLHSGPNLWSNCPTDNQNIFFLNVFNLGVPTQEEVGVKCKKKKLCISGGKSYMRSNDKILILGEYKKETGQQLIKSYRDRKITHLFSRKQLVCFLHAFMLQIINTNWVRWFHVNCPRSWPKLKVLILEPLSPSKPLRRSVSL